MHFNIWFMGQSTPCSYQRVTKSKYEKKCTQEIANRYIPIDQFTANATLEKSRATIACQDPIMFARASITAHHTYQSKMLKFPIAIHQCQRIWISVGKRTISVGTAIGWHILWSRRPRQYSIRRVTSNWRRRPMI